MSRYDIKMQRAAVETKQHKQYGQLNASYKERLTWYGTERWRLFREEYIREHKYCVICRRAGKVQPSEIVDHVDGHDPFTWKETFWTGGDGGFQALCWSCHSRKTALEDQKNKPKRLSASARAEALKNIQKKS